MTYNPHADDGSEMSRAAASLRCAGMTVSDYGGFLTIRSDVEVVEGIPIGHNSTIVEESNNDEWLARIGVQGVSLKGPLDELVPKIIHVYSLVRSTGRSIEEIAEECQRRGWPG